jgi:hypothetical protein
MPQHATPSIANKTEGGMNLGAEHPDGPLTDMDSLSNDGTFFGSHLRWPADRSHRTFVVRVVEPGKYAPGTHGGLFSAVVTELIIPTPGHIDPFKRNIPPPPAQRFDLVTFPEAFASTAALLPMLRMLKSMTPTGCIHVGLRPSEDLKQHLFTPDELWKLVSELEALAPNISSDLRDFRLWLGKQPAHLYFNIGCLFMVDADRTLRVCLHPKLLRSKFESNPLPERHVEEADLLTLITLVPSDKRLLSVTLQALICSDALDLPNDRKNAPPMQAITQHAACFGETLPDHVDVVSVVTCTPQSPGKTQAGQPFRAWHEKFQNAFTSAAQGTNFDRHHFAAIILANFHTLEDEAPGGLSGVFMPVPPRKGDFPYEVTVSCFGRVKADKGRHTWSTPDDRALEHWDSQGFVAGIDPFWPPPDAPLKMLGFTIQRLPRDNSRWEAPESITRLSVQVARFDEVGTMRFVSEGERHAD